MTRFWDIWDILNLTNLLFLDKKKQECVPSNDVSRCAVDNNVCLEFPVPH